MPEIADFVYTRNITSHTELDQNLTAARLVVALISAIIEAAWMACP